MITAKLIGRLEGVIWMPAVVSRKCVSVNLTDDRRRLTPRRAGSLRHMVVDIVSDGDFRLCKLSQDSCIEVTSITHSLTSSMRPVRHVRTKIFYVSEFPSIADLVAKEA